MRAEYANELARLRFPDGFVPPMTPPEGQPGANYQTGFGRSTADFMWICAWSQEWIAQEVSNPRAAAQALNELAGLPTVALWNSIDPGSREVLLSAVEHARQGDGSGLQAQIRDIDCTRLLAK